MLPTGCVSGPVASQWHERNVRIANRGQRRRSVSVGLSPMWYWALGIVRAHEQEVFRLVFARRSARVFGHAFSGASDCSLGRLAFAARFYNYEGRPISIISLGVRFGRIWYHRFISSTLAALSAASVLDVWPTRVRPEASSSLLDSSHFDFYQHCFAYHCLV